MCKRQEVAVLLALLALGGSGANAMGPRPPSATRSAGRAEAGGEGGAASAAPPAEVQQWLDRLASTSRAVRREAVSRLAAFGAHAAPAVPELIRLLHDEPIQTGEPRTDAANALMSVGPPAVEPLLAALDSADDKARRRIVVVLASIGDPRAAPALAAALRDADPTIRRNAARGLYLVPSRSAVAPLVEALRDDESDVRRAAVRALTAIRDPRTVEPLIALLYRESGSSETMLAEDAAWALAVQGDPRAVAPLTLLMYTAGGRFYSDRCAANALRVLGEAGDQALIDALQSPVPHIRHFAFRRLRGTENPAAVEALVAATADPDAEVRGMAASALASTGDPRAVERLIVLLRDDSPEVRGTAVHALGRLGDARAVQPLCAALATDGGNRLRIIASLGWIGDPRAAPALAALLGDPDAEAGRAAGDALHGLGRRGMQRLAAALKSDNPNACRRAAEVLGRSKSPLAVEPLLEVLAHEAPHVRRAAAVALRRLNDARAVAPLAELLKDTDVLVRLAAVETLGQLDALAVSARKPRDDRLDPDLARQAEAAHRMLAALAEREEDASVRAAAIRSCANLGVRYGASGMSWVPYLPGSSGVVAPAPVGPIPPTPYLPGYPETSASFWHRATDDPLVLQADLEAARRLAPADVRRPAQLLGDPSRLIRQAAMKTLVAAGDKAVGPAVEALGSRDVPTRLAAADVLTQLASRSRPGAGATCAEPAGARGVPRAGAAYSPAVAPLLAALDDPSDEVRCQAARALGAIGDARAVAPLTAILEKKLDFPPTPAESELRQAAYDAMAALRSPDMIPQLVAALKDPQRADATWAVRLLNGMGREGADALWAALREGVAGGNRDAILSALTSNHDLRVVDVLLADLQGEDKQARDRALRHLSGLEDQRMVEPLIAAMSDSDPKFAQSAAYVLAQLGDPRGEEALLAMFGKTRTMNLISAPLFVQMAPRYPEVADRLLSAIDSDDRSTRLLAVVAAAATRDRRAIEPLLSIVKKGDDPKVLSAAAGSLAAFRDPRAVEPLLALAQDTRSPARADALRALDAFRDPRTIEPLLAILREEPGSSVEDSAPGALFFPHHPTPPSPDTVRGAAHRALLNVTGPGAVAPFVKALASDDAQVRRFAAAQLGRIGDRAAAAPLIGVMEDDCVEVRRAAVVALAMLADPRAVDPLVAAVNDADPHIQALARVALRCIDDPRAAEAAAALPKPSVPRPEPLAPLHRFPWDSPTAAPRPPTAGQLRGLLKYDDDPDSRFWAIYTLGEMKDPEAVEPLAAAVRNPAVDDRYWAIPALGKIGGAEAVEALAAALEDAEPGVRRRAVRALARTRSAEAVEPLIAVLEDQSPEIRQAAAAALGELQDPRAVDPLIAVLSHGQDRGLAEEAARSLGKIGDRRAVEPLIAALREYRLSPNSAAAEALGELGDARAVEALRDAVKESGAYLFTTAACDSLRKILAKNACEPIPEPIPEP